MLFTLACADKPKPVPPSTCGPEQAVVSRILDGDTVETAAGDKIRYLLINAPEIAHNNSETTECFADEATQLNRSWVFDNNVRLEYDEECKDRYGRLLAYVYVGERMVNRVLIERGYARLEIIPPNYKFADEFRQLAAAAQAAHAGLWGACP